MHDKQKRHTLPSKRIADKQSATSDSEFGEGSLHILNYHGTFYITYNNMVTGLYMDYDGVPRATCNNLTRESIVSVRYASEDEARSVFNSVKSRI